MVRIERSKDEGLNKARFDRGTLIASGFIAGGALMGVVSALLKFAEVDWFLSGWAPRTPPSGRGWRCTSY